MEQIRPLTALSHDELIARIEQHVEVLRIKEAEIVELHRSVDALKERLAEARTTIDRQAATIRQYEREMEAIGAGGVPLMGGAYAAAKVREALEKAESIVRSNADACSSLDVKAMLHSNADAIRTLISKEQE